MEWRHRLHGGIVALHVFVRILFGVHVLLGYDLARREDDQQK
jgi:hypothetical protein